MSVMNVECFIELILIFSNMIYFTIQILEEGIFYYHPSLDCSYVSKCSYLNHSHAHIFIIKAFHLLCAHWHFSADMAIWKLMQYTMIVNLTVSSTVIINVLTLYSANKSNKYSLFLDTLLLKEKHNCGMCNIWCFILRWNLLCL